MGFSLVMAGLKYPCPGRGAAFFMPLRRAGTVPNTGVRYGPGSAAHYHSASKTRVNALMVKNGALHCVRGTERFKLCLSLPVPCCSYMPFHKHQQTQTRTRHGDRFRDSPGGKGDPRESPAVGA